MPKDLISQLEEKYLSEQLGDIVGDKLTLPLTVLRHLRDGKRVEKRLIERSIHDLQAIVKKMRVHNAHSSPKTTRRPARPLAPGSTPSSR